VRKNDMAAHGDSMETAISELHMVTGGVSSET
jgi:hypothetical protein